MSLLCFTNAACHLLKICVSAQTLMPAFTKESRPHRQHMGAATTAPQSPQTSVGNRRPSGSCELLPAPSLCDRGTKGGSGGVEEEKGKKEEGGGGGPKLTRKKTETERRSHWKMGESTYWYQPELLGTVPSLAAKELWNIFVRAGFLYSPLQTFSDCSLTKRPTLLVPIPASHTESRLVLRGPPTKLTTGLFICYVSLEKKQKSTTYL